jgi:23S rRNA pseudouridine2457 synthase
MQWPVVLQETTPYIAFMAQRPSTGTCLFFKPFGVLCQFSTSPGRQTLADFGPLPDGVYPAGRLDAESEGLLLLTADGLLQQRLTDPRWGHPRTYLAQVEGTPTEGDCRVLRSGVVLDRRLTLPAEVDLLAEEPALPPRPVPIRFRKSIPTAWLRLTLREGRNRQVRRMTAAVGYPTLRLVRIAIGRLTIAGLAPGEWRYLLTEEEAALNATLRTETPHRNGPARRSSAE